MTTVDLILVVLVPLCLAAAMGPLALRPLVTRLAPWAPLPALVLSVTAYGTPAFELDTVLLGLRLDASPPQTRAFLAFTAILWIFAGLFGLTYVNARPHASSFWFFFLVTMAGNIGTILADSVATFYVFYAVMTFAAYGLIVHERTAGARRAARTYIAMALGGETLLLVAFLLIVSERIDLPFRDVPISAASSPYRTFVCVFLLAGFGVKAGLVFLHLWLPLAHPVAPTPASAVLSGTIIEVALLGWLRFLPFGTVCFPELGLSCAALGFVTALYGGVVGVMQDEPKSVLAYSSVSQMGFAIAAVGIGLASPTAAGAAQAAILFFAIHHAMAKGALFLGASVATATRGDGWPRRLVLLGLLAPALAIAGAPLTSGALAKSALKDVMTLAPRSASELVALLSIAAIGSTLLMIRFLTLAAPAAGATRQSPQAGLWVPWLLLQVAGAALVLYPAFRPEPLASLLSWSALWSAAWPLLAGLGLAWTASIVLRRLGRDVPTVPPGDVLVFVEAAARKARRTFGTAGRRARRMRRRLQLMVGRRLRLQRRIALLSAHLQRADRRLSEFEKVGALLLGLFVALLPLLFD